jgi:Putative zincin peptidase
VQLRAPAGYNHQGDLFADLADTYQSELHLIVVANLLALIPLLVVALLVWLPYQLYVAVGAPLALFNDPQWPQWAFWLAGLVVVVCSLLLHEALHGAALLMQGHRPKFGYASGYPYATIQPGAFLTRRQYLTMALTPLTVMTLGGAVGLVWLPVSIGQIVLMAVLLNAAASIGDLAVASRARRWPPGTLFAADERGIQVFTRETTLYVNLSGASSE